MNVTRPEQLTPAVLTAVLRAGGMLDPGNAVTAVRTGPTGGSGLIADIRRIEIGYARPAVEAPRTLVVKSSADTADSRALAAVEIRFYRDGPARDAGLSTPVVHHAEIDARTGDCLVLLEDLGDDGFVRQVDGCTPDEAAAVLGEVARLHAHGYRSDPAAHPGWIPAPADAAVTAFSRRWLTSCDEWPTALDDVAPALVSNLDELAARLAGPPATIVHGDLHCQNVHRGEDGITLIDFQFLQRAVGVLDVARFLGTSLTVEVRRRHETDLLRHYVAELVRQGVDDPATAVPADGMRAALLWNLAVPLALHVRGIRTAGTGWPRTLPILERCAAAARDWDALSVVAHPGARRGPP